MPVTMAVADRATKSLLGTFLEPATGLEWASETTERKIRAWRMTPIFCRGRRISGII